MTKEDIKYSLLGKAVMYMEGKGFQFWTLLGKIESIIENNIHYESYDMTGMERDLVNYLEELKKEADK